MASNTLSRELEPSFGKLTWAEEGKEGGIFHSRKLHVPPGASGATVGRGYDMKTKSSRRIKSDMVSIGISTELAEKLSKLAGLVGENASKKIVELGLKDIDILNPEQQLELFKRSYKSEEFEAARVCSKPDVTQAYGDCNWDTMNKYLREFITDLKYQGLYSPETRKFLQEAIAKRDYKLLKKQVIEKLPSKYLLRNLQRVKLLKEAENYDSNTKIQKPTSKQPKSQHQPPKFKQEPQILP